MKLIAETRLAKDPDTVMEYVLPDMPVPRVGEYIDFEACTLFVSRVTYRLPEGQVVLTMDDTHCAPNYLMAAGWRVS